MRLLVRRTRLRLAGHRCPAQNSVTSPGPQVRFQPVILQNFWARGRGAAIRCGGHHRRPPTQRLLRFTAAGGPVLTGQMRHLPYLGSYRSHPIARRLRREVVAMRLRRPGLTAAALLLLAALSCAPGLVAARDIRIGLTSCDTIPSCVSCVLCEPCRTQPPGTCAACAVCCGMHVSMPRPAAAAATPHGPQALCSWRQNPDPPGGRALMCLQCNPNYQLTPDLRNCSERPQPWDYRCLQKGLGADRDRGTAVALHGMPRRCQCAEHPTPRPPLPCGGSPTTPTPKHSLYRPVQGGLLLRTPRPGVPAVRLRLLLPRQRHAAHGLHPGNGHRRAVFKGAARLQWVSGGWGGAKTWSWY